MVVGHAPAGTAALFLDGKGIDVAPDGRFLIGFDRDHGESATLSAQLADGRTVSTTFAVLPRAWKFQHVNIARRPSGPTAEYLRLRERELARISAARAAKADSGGWRQRFIWPSRGRISGVFGSQRIYRGEPAPSTPALTWRQARAPPSSLPPTAWWFWLGRLASAWKAIS